MKSDICMGVAKTEFAEGFFKKHFRNITLNKIEMLIFWLNSVVINKSSNTFQNEKKMQMNPNLSKLLDSK